MKPGIQRDCISTRTVVETSPISPIDSLRALPSLHPVDWNFFAIGILAI